MGTTNNSNENSEFISRQFNAMENRYHTWMNYYSLFNGALLVAYCTLIVSTGTVVNTQSSDKIIYSLHCGYWGLLVLVALLGVIASYCWLLSMIGHQHWLDNWRRKLQVAYPGEMHDISGDTSLASQCRTTRCGKQVIPGLYSTLQITKAFIGSVIAAWAMILSYSLSNYIDYSLSTSCMVGIGLFIIALFYLLQCVFQDFLCSDITGFTINKANEQSSKKGICQQLSDFLCAPWRPLLKLIIITVLVCICKCEMINFLTHLWAKLFE